MIVKKNIKVVIDRKKWCRGGKGGKGGKSALVNGLKNMCCLGFLGAACGFSKVEMYLVPTPEAMKIEDERSKWPELICDPFGYNTSITEKLIDVNDDSILKERTREKNIITLGKKAGINFQFIN